MREHLVADLGGMSDAYGGGLGRERDNRGASAARRLAATCEGARSKLKCAKGRTATTTSRPGPHLLRPAASALARGNDNNAAPQALPPSLGRERDATSPGLGVTARSGFLACSGRPPSPAPFWFRFRLHVQNARLGSAPAADPGNVLASVHRLKGQDVPSGGILAGEQPGRSRGAAVSRSGRST